MDNPLTPNKIQTLMHLAEDKSFRWSNRVLKNNGAESSLTQLAFSQTGTNCESSGILDLERVEGFGDSDMGLSLNKSNAFKPGEMTGRSTEAEDVDNPRISEQSRGFEEYGRHSMALDSITSHMDKQTSEIHDIMRHSIASNYSFHSKRDLTADEASLVLREAPLPVQHSTQVNIHDSMLVTASSMSAYFQNRCPELEQILGKVDSPDRPVITEVSSTPIEVTSNNTYKMDQTLDSVPVRQPRTEKLQEKSVVTNLFPNNVKMSVFTAPKQPDIAVTNKLENTIQKAHTNVMEAKSKNKGQTQKGFMCSTKPADILLRNLQSSLQVVSDDTECSMENSLSISKIADYLGKQSNISVTDILQLNNQKKQIPIKQPLTEVHMNILENKDMNKDCYVTNIRDTKRTETASSAGTVDTVISLDKLQISEKNAPPLLLVNRHSLDTENSDTEGLKSPRLARSNSPSSKNQSTLTTVQENLISFKSGDSPLHNSRGEDTSRIPSPNLKYRELDSSVDWNEVLKRKRLTQERSIQERWAEIRTSPVEGFVGVSATVTISVVMLVDNWLTAKFEFDNLPSEGRDLNIELPRLPLLLSPLKTEKFTLNITSNVEMSARLPFTMYLKDASIDCEMEHTGCLEVDFKMPVIQALSGDGVNKITFPTIHEKSAAVKSFVIIGDSPVDLQLELSIAVGESVFVIKSVQEIKKNDVSKVLMERAGCSDDGQVKGKKGNSKQLCRLSSGNAIKVAVIFNSPKLAELELSGQTATFNGILNVNLIGINFVLKKVDLIGSVGCAKLILQPNANIVITNEPAIINLYNSGNVTGTWNVKFRNKTNTDGHFPFKVSATRVELRPGAASSLKLVYVGPPDVLNEGILILEDTSNGGVVSLAVAGGSERCRPFPVKTNHNNMSWARAGRKELSLKNCTSGRVQVRCRVAGDGFSLDAPGADSRAACVLALAPCECRALPVLFAPGSCLPHAAALHLLYDKTADLSRKIKLHGCSSDGAVRWSGLLTYGDTALVRAAPRGPVPLALHNSAAAPAFVCARVHFNLQYRFIAAEAQLSGERCVVARRATHTLSLSVPWTRLERRARLRDATALATVTVLAGPEFTRRRLLRILRNESTGEVDTSSLPEHLRVLAEPFEGEDLTLDNYLQDFSETKAALNELIEGIQELTAQIDLPQDFADDNTILITDDTVLEHHTLCD